MVSLQSLNEARAKVIAQQQKVFFFQQEANVSYSIIQLMRQQGASETSDYMMSLRDRYQKETAQVNECVKLYNAYRAQECALAACFYAL